jgi:thiamine pyrophosphate-dependent acetolactate synthase large subunit-like protein
MRELVAQFLDNQLSRRGFIRSMAAAGFAASAIQGILTDLEAAEIPINDSSHSYRTVTGTGGELWVEQLKASGVDYLFANPGSLETGFFDAFTDTPGMQMIMGMHEGIVISMADGYHLATGKPSFVNVHAMPGTAQTAGQLYNAYHNKSAMVITAGMSDNTIFNDDNPLSATAGNAHSDVTDGFTKISWDLRNAKSIPMALRRAFKVASTSPGGPVFIAVATYAMAGEKVTAQIIDQKKYDVPMRPRPDSRKVDLIARKLIEGKQPLFVTGMDLHRSGAVEAAVKLVELTGTPILDAQGGSFINSGFPTQHPLYWDGKTFPGNYSPYDVIVGLGAEDVAVGRGGADVPVSISKAEHAWKAAIGIDANMMGRTGPLELGVIADPKAAIDDLMESINSLATKSRLEKIQAERSARINSQIVGARKKILAEIKASYGKTPMHPYELAMTIDQAIDHDAITVNENLSHDFRLKYHAVQAFGGKDRMRIAAGGAGLGWGIGAAIGAKVGEPNRQVVLNIGDGSVMYSASGFWSMARYQVPILTIVWNNHNYQTVRHGFADYKGKMAETGHYTGMYLGDPDIDYIKLADSQGVSGEKVTNVSDLKKALKRGIAATRAGEPYLLEVLIDQFGSGAGSDWHDKFSLADKRTRKV